MTPVFSSAEVAKVARDPSPLVITGAMSRSKAMIGRCTQLFWHKAVELGVLEVCAFASLT